MELKEGFHPSLYQEPAQHGGPRILYFLNPQLSKPCSASAALTNTCPSVYLRLHHGRTLRAQGFHGLEHVDHALIAHALQNNAQCDEHPSAAHPGAVWRQWYVRVLYPSKTFSPAPSLYRRHSPPAVHRDGPILPKLLLGLVHLSNEVDKALACLGHALLWPVCELELPDGP